MRRALLRDCACQPRGWRVRSAGRAQLNGGAAASFLNAARVAVRARVIVRASHVAGVCAVLKGISCIVAKGTLEQKANPVQAGLHPS